MAKATVCAYVQKAAELKFLQIREKASVAAAK
jgi:hypothetical protein